MTHFLRFGRRLPAASSLSVSHALRALSADGNARQRCAEAEGLPRTASWDAIMDHRGGNILRLAPER